MQGCHAIQISDHVSLSKYDCKCEECSECSFELICNGEDEQEAMDFLVKEINSGLGE